MPTQGRQGVLSLPRAWTSPVFYTTGPRRGEVARKATRNRNRNSLRFSLRVPVPRPLSTLKIAHSREGESHTPPGPVLFSYSLLLIVVVCCNR